jgi:ureidoglycolate lyase
VHVTIRELSEEAFAPYGMVIQQPAAVADASGNGWQWWSQTAVIPQTDKPYVAGYLSLQPGPLQFDWAEYHKYSPEVIIPLGYECLIYVGTPDPEPDWERIEGFRIRPGQAVVLQAGVWHGAPLALDQPLTALVLLRQGTGLCDVYKATHRGGPLALVDGA